MALDVDTIIDRLGGAEAAARLAGIGTEAVRKWRQARAIPSRHWQTVLAATGLTLADLPAGEIEGEAPPAGATAALVLADGSVFWGVGYGAHTPETGGEASEICFCTSMTGYQETVTDPSYAGQVIVFTFPHIGNVGTNPADLEAETVFASGIITRELVTEPSNWRSTRHFVGFLESRGIPGIAGIDTRALTLRIRDRGAPNGALAYPASGRFDLDALRARAAAWTGLEGQDLAKRVSCTQTYQWEETRWAWPAGGLRQTAPKHHVVAVDYGAKRNILRSLASAGCRVTVVPAASTAEEILRHAPDGVFLSNGPGDPATTAEYAAPAIRGVLDAGVPIFGICLGHQLLALALGARTYKLARGHRGANQPVKELATGRVEITSQNHGFAVDDASLPNGVDVTHVSLFDGSNEGLACRQRNAFSVQYHPEAGPGPSDAAHLFDRFAKSLT